MQSETMFQLKLDKQELEYILNRSACKLRYKSKRTINYINKLNNIVDILNSIPSIILSDIPSHKFYIIIRNIIRDLLMDWYISENLIEEEIYLLQNSILFFNRLVDIVNDITQLTSWLIDPSFINSLAECMSDIDRLLYKNKNKKFFKQLIRLFDVFGIYYERLPLKFQNEHGLDRLFEAIMSCLVSSNYDQTFKKFKSNAKSIKHQQTFFLINCPSFISSYHGLQANKMIEQILDTMIPRYALLLDQHIQSIKEWTFPIIHAIHHLLLTVIFARGYYSPYANGQPLQWLIDHIIRIISEESFINKVNEKSTNPETVLINSALRTLHVFVHEPDLLVYIKHLKTILIFRPLVFLSNESIVFHAYVMLAYTLEEEDIKSSEKDSGRLLSKIFDSLRKQIKSLSITNKNKENIGRNIFLLIEALLALVQHDQIKSEILKQNALSLLIDGYQYFNDQSKCLLLELLASITFDEEAARLLRENTEFIHSIKDMQTTTDDGINKAADKIIWNLINAPEREKKSIEKTTESDENKKEDKLKKDAYQHDIMISYCHADKELVYRIHKFLSDKGFKIWFDRDNIYGPAMQAMADAVENTEFIILCMSDSYKRSAYCQAEVEYAFRCKRHLLPVIVRQGYRADGWLGLIMGSRIYVDFGRIEFKNACQLILKEITLQRENKLKNKNEKISEHTIDNDYSEEVSPKSKETFIKIIEKFNLPNEYLNRNTIGSKYRFISIKQWTRKDVLDFIHDKNLHYMMPLCETMTGLGLIKLVRICQTKSNQFYKQLNDEFISRSNGLHLPVGIFTQFLSEIDRLIDSSSKQDTLQSESVSSLPLSIVKRTTSPPLLLIPTRRSSLELNSITSSQETTVPPLPAVQALRNVQITKQTAYRTEPLTNSTNNFIVQSSQDPSAVHSEQTTLGEQAWEDQQINIIPYRRTSYTYDTQSVQNIIYP